MSDEGLSKEMDKSIRLYIAGYALAISFGTEESFRSGYWGLGIMGFIVSAILQFSWVFWSWLKPKLGKEFVLRLGALATDPRWIVAACVALLATMVLSPYVEQRRWPFSPTDAVVMGSVAPASRAEELQPYQSGENREQAAKYYQLGIVKSAEILRKLSELLLQNQKKPMTWSITTTPDNEQIRQEISSIMEGACHVVGLRAGLNSPCLIEPIQPFPTHPTLENPAQTLPQATNSGIVIHNSGAGAEFENTYRVLSEAFAAACIKVQRSGTLPPIVAAVHGGDDPDFFWIEIGPGDPWADSRCFG